VQPAIRIENLSKMYRVEHGRPRSAYRTLRESLMNAAAAPLRRLGGHAPPRSEDFWALKDVSFEVRPGEVVGIIGRNGAGKSTLLKILSQITKPTTGRVEINGRVGSLLEVGTGFHPELTGRENVFLNGSILGMSRSEVARKFDEIAAFAEVDQFLDTPVKRYSSGMYIRLAFAVAAHLEPELLILDEVLSVGDVNFQKKCLGKMEDVADRGRTVLFVSHSMNAVTRLCPRAVLLHKGRVIADGTSEDVTRVYLRSDHGTMAARSWPERDSAPGNDIARLRSFRACDRNGKTKEVFDIREPVGIEITFEVLESGHVLVPNFPVHNEFGTCVFHLAESDPHWKRRSRPAGTYTCTAWLPGNLLSEGMLIVSAVVSTMDPVKVHFYDRDSIAFQIIDPADGTTARGDYHGTYPGVVRPLVEWTTESHTAKFEN
jgi:lipopolysaccharide transport system ATP-binding protein